MLSHGDDEDYKSYKGCDDNMREMATNMFHPESDQHVVNDR